MHLWKSKVAKLELKKNVSDLVFTLPPVRFVVSFTQCTPRTCENMSSVTTSVPHGP